MAQFFHITLSFQGQQKGKEMEPAIESVSMDWMRYTAHCWIIWSNSNAFQIYDALAPHLGTEDVCLVAPINLDVAARQGKLYEWEWKWLNKPR